MLNLNARFTTSFHLALAVFFVAGPALTQAAAPAGRLSLDGQIVRTHVVPAPLPNGGVDPLYMITNGVSNQVSVIRYGPGSPNYQGGAWAVNVVTFNSGVTPYLLTSAAAVDAAEPAGDITVTRMPNLDNRCPVNP